MNIKTENNVSIIGVFLLTLFIGFVGKDSSAANGEYVTMLREDRIWEYKSGLYSYDDFEYFTMKVLGSVQINGTEYKAFGFTRIVIFSDPDLKNLVTDTCFNGNGDKFFLREENGKIYVLMYGDAIYSTDDYIDNLHLPVDGEMGLYFSERLQYNSTLPSGSLVDPYIMDSMTDESMRIRQYAGEEIEIDGELCRLFGLDVRWDEDINPDLESPTLSKHGAAAWIEGIGVIDAGILPFLYGLFKITGGPANAIARFSMFQPTLQGIYNADGDLLFGMPSVIAENQPLSESGLKVGSQGNRIWVTGEGSLSINLFNLEGKMIAQEKGIDEVILSIAEIDKGIYIMDVSDGKTVRSFKFSI